MMGADTVVRRGVTTGYETALLGRLNEVLESTVVIVDEGVDRTGACG